MLEALQTLARFLAPVRWFFGLSLLIFLLLFVLNLIDVESFANQSYTIPLIVGFLWSLSLLSFSGLFQNVPAPVSPKLSFFKRQKARVVRFGYWLLATLTLAVNAGVLFLTLRLVLVWLRD